MIQMYLQFLGDRALWESRPALQNHIARNENHVARNEVGILREGGNLLLNGTVVCFELCYSVST